MKRPFLIALIIVMGASLVHAATGYWTNVSGGIFAAGANWSPAIPGAGDTALFTNDGTYTVSFDADAAVSDVQHSNRQGIVTLDIGAGRTWTVTNTYSIGRGAGTTGSVWLTSGTLLLDNASNTARFLVGDAGLGSLVITNGAKLICNTTNRVTVGNTVSGVGKTNNFALVTGSGSTWSNRGTLAIGYTESGSGANYSRLSVEEGALLQAGGLVMGSGANGSSVGARLWVAGSGTVVTVTGTLNMATTTAQLTITNGAQVADAVGTVLGLGAVVAGTGSLWTNRSYVTVGFGANNVSLLVTNGASLYAGGYLTSGGSGGSTVTNDVVTVADSNAAVTAQRIYVGESHRNGGGSFSGYHGLRVLDGGRVSCATGTVGSATFSMTMLDNDKNSALNNYAVVSGSGSRWEIGTLLSVGQNGTNNSLTIDSGGVVVVTGNVTISPRHPAYGDITNRENYISVEGGRLYVTNVAGTANLAVNRSWVAMKGSLGGLAVNSLTLTNSGTLRFTADTDGFSTIDVSGTMLVGTQSFLTVDMAGYGGTSNQIALVRYGSMPTAFTNANILVTNGTGWIVQGDGNTIWLYTQSASVPQISNIGSQNLTDESADMVGQLITNGSPAATIYLYWSTTDGRNNAAAWTASGGVSNLGAMADGVVFTNTIPGLAPNTTYFWNLSASNDAGVTWAELAGSPSFKTLGLPAVSVAAGASGIGAFAATLNGSLTNGGSAQVYVYYWINGGLVTNSCNLGLLVEGGFATNVTGLIPSTAYVYQIYATNAYGVVMSVPVSFTTTAGVFTWTNAAGGVYSVAGNWSPSLVPGAADTALFTNDGTYTVSFDANASVSVVQHSNRQGTVMLDIGAGRTWTVTNTYSIGRGSGTTGSVWLTSGTLLLDNASNTAQFLVGDAGLGSLVITNGAKLICNTTNRVTVGNTVSGVGKTNNFALVTGSGSTWSNRGTLAIGYTESGSGANYSRLSVEEGALLQAGGLVMGSGANGSSVGARLWVAGSGTVVAVTGTLNMATTTAQLTITNGAQVADAVGTVLGLGAVVTGPGSLWTNRSYVTVGFGVNNVSLLVTNGAALYAGGYLTMGGATASNDVVTVVGSNAAVTAQRIYVGESHRNGGVWYSGYHGLRVLEGGLVSCATGTVGSATYNLTSLDNDPLSALNNYAVVSGSGSRWAIGTLLLVGQNGTNNSLTIGTGGVVAVTGNVAISPSPYGGINNRDNYISVEGGRLYVTNAAGTANLAVNRSWVEMKGSMGGVTASSLTLTNSGTLRFTADTDGVSPIDVSGTMLVGTQSFLIVDMAGYQGASSQIPLVRYGSMPTAFTNANITLTNGVGRIMQGPDNTIWLYASRSGTVYAIR